MEAQLKLPPFAIALALLAGCIQPAAEDERQEDADWLIPYLDATPALDESIAPGEWAAALVFESRFELRDERPGRPYEGEFPFRVAIGHRGDRLYLLAIITNITGHPGTHSDGNGTNHYPDYFNIYFAMGTEGPLAVPSDLLICKHFRGRGGGLWDGYWTGERWTRQERGEPTRLLDPYPKQGRSCRAGLDSANATIFWEISIPKRPFDRRYDGLDLEANDRFRIAFGFERALSSPEVEQGAVVGNLDVHPGVGYTPENAAKPETWLSVQLAPPASIAPEGHARDPYAPTA